MEQGKFVHLRLPSISTLVLELTWEENNSTLSEEDIYHIITLNNDLVLLSVDNNQDSKEYRVRADYFLTGFESISSPYVLRVRGVYQC